MRDCRPANREKVEERQRENAHPVDETTANATTYPVDVGAGHRKTYNLTDGDRVRYAKREFDLLSRASIITGIFVDVAR